MGRIKWVAVLLLGTLYLVGCSKVKEPAQPEAEWTQVQEGVAVLSDGEQVDLWQSDTGGYDFYKLGDGTELLAVRGPDPLEECYTAGVEGFDTLGPEAKRKIRFYFEEQGLLYDVQAELENAYADYQKCQAEGEPWLGRTVTQDIMPAASSSHMISFCTTVNIDGQMQQDARLGALFERETGDRLDLWSMFSVPQETAMERLLEGGEITDPALFAALAAAIRPERVIFFQDHVEISFSELELPGVEEDCVFKISYSELADVLEEWAIPG